MTAPRRGQTLGLCWGSVPGASVLEMARVAAANGMVALAVIVDQFASATCGVAETRRELRRLGVRVAVIDPLIQPLPGAPAVADVAEPRLRRLVGISQADCWRVGEALEAAAINLTHFLGGPVELARMQDAVAGLAEANHARGFATTFEFIPGTGVPDLATAAALTAASPHTRIMFDTWHFARSGGTLADIDALPPGAIGAAQINDWRPPEPGAPYVPMSGRLMPGEGCLPHADILRRIEANAPGLDVQVEVFSAEVEALGWEAAVRRMARASRPLLAPGAG